MSKRMTVSKAAGVSRRRGTITGRHAPDEQDLEPFAEKQSCALHAVTYYVPANAKAKCPVCQLEKMVDTLNAEVKSLRQENEMFLNQIDTLQFATDLKSKFSNAATILEEDDLFWLKEQLYQYKIDKSVVLRVTDRPLGFMAVTRSGGAEVHAMTSIGGAALVSAYREAITTVGSANAMKLMTDALWKILPGARP